jgi:hypothetical protein
MITQIDPFKSAPTLSNEDAVQIVKIVAPAVLLPHPDVVSQFDGPVWPVVRNGKKRYTHNEERTLVYDDNMLARWALLWSHGIVQTGFPSGWTVAHVWADPKESTSFTNLANLALMPEYFGSLSDKNGPLAVFLRWHSSAVYGWQPKDAGGRSLPLPKAPQGFDEISWHYFEPIHESKDVVSAVLAKSNSKAATTLKYVLSQLSEHSLK